jgi:two-component system response regulator QseB
MRILLVEDDLMIGESLARGLRDEGYTVDWVNDGVVASIALQDREAAYAVALLDWGLPRQDGLQVLRAIRSHGVRTPILMLTARDAIDDRILGLDSGADDYLVKPFELSELKARIRSLLRRGEHLAGTVLTHGSLTLDPAQHRVTRASDIVSLGPREFALLRIFLERPHTILSRRQLEDHLYGWDAAIESNAIEYLIHALRKKFGAALIENVRGVGWRLGSCP